MATQPLLDAETIVELIVIGWVLFVIGFGLWAGAIAASKGRSRGVWIFAGLVFGLFAVLAVALLPMGGPPCPACRRPLHPQATICPSCRTERPVKPHRKDLRNAARAE